MQTKTHSQLQAELAASQTALKISNPTYLGLVKSCNELRKIADSGIVPLIIAFSEQKGEDRFDKGSTWRKVRDIDHLALKAADILARLEATEDYKDACAEINPLMQTVERLTAETGLASRKKSEAVQELAKAQQAANDTAQALAEKDPAVAKAKKELANA